MFRSIIELCVRFRAVIIGVAATAMALGTIWRRSRSPMASRSHSAMLRLVMGMAYAMDPRSAPAGAEVARTEAHDEPGAAQVSVEQTEPNGKGTPAGVAGEPLRVSVEPAEPNGQKPPHQPADHGSLAGSFTLSYIFGFAVLGGLVLAAGFWDVIANTRLLAALISAGIIPLGEDDPGFGLGIPEVNMWIRSQDPVAWQLVLLAAALFIAVAVLKGLQFHRLSRLTGIDGTFGQHLRAFFYGHGLGRMLPYRVGEVAWASALESQGSSLSHGSRVVFMFKGFLLFEIITFALLSLFLNGLLPWGIGLVPPLAILGAAWLFTRARRPHGAQRGQRRAAIREAFGELLSQPRMLIELAGLSLLSFFFVEIASYIIPMAFSTVTVPLIQNELRIIVVSAPLIFLAVVGSYIARLVPVTPGGIGQFEWAFALVLTTGGLPFTEAAVLALLVSGVRYATGAMLFGGILLTYGIETNLRRVLAIFQRPSTVSSGKAG